MNGIAEFQAAHDKNYIIPDKITKGIIALSKLGPDVWEYEVAFLKRCGISTTDFAMFRDQFQDFMVLTKGHNPKRVWCASKVLAKKFREMVG